MTERLDDQGHGDKESEPAMKPLSAPGAYLCETTERYAAYWVRGAHNAETRAEAQIATEQAVNGWKNLAYDLARQVHYAMRAGFIDERAVASSAERLILDRCHHALGESEHSDDESLPEAIAVHISERNQRIEELEARLAQSASERIDWQEMLLLRWCEWTGKHINDATFLREVSQLVSDNLLVGKSTCPYCTSDNPAIRTTYYDQTCGGCVKRMGKP